MTTLLMLLACIRDAATAQTVGRVADAVVIGSRIIQLLESAPQGQEAATVADFLADMKLDAVAIAAGLLHDVVEDTGSSNNEIADRFGWRSATAAKDHALALVRNGGITDIKTVAGLLWLQAGLPGL